MELSPIVFPLAITAFIFIIAKTWAFCMAKLEKHSSNRETC